MCRASILRYADLQKPIPKSEVAEISVAVLTGDTNLTQRLAVLWAAATFRVALLLAHDHFPDLPMPGTLVPQSYRETQRAIPVVDLCPSYVCY